MLLKLYGFSIQYIKIMLDAGPMNQVTDKIMTGTIGELLVQIRLLQFGVQAAPPIKDSGNDLIAVNSYLDRL